MVGADSFIDILEGHGIPFRRSPEDPNEFTLCCVFCEDRGETPDTRFRLGVNVETGQGHCYNCDWGCSGDKDAAVDLVLEQLEITGYELPAAPKKEKPLEKLELPEDFCIVKQVSEDKDYWGYRAYKYLKSRHVSERQREEKRIGYSLVGKYAYRIVLPIFYKKKLRGIVSRAFVSKMEPPYLNSEGEKYLYNRPDHPSSDALLVEGAFDALACERALRKCGIDSMGVLGHSLTPKQIKQLRPYNTIYIWGDPDKPGVAGIVSMSKQLEAEKKSVKVVMFSSDEEYDPSEYFPDEIKSRVKKAQPFSDSTENRLRNWVANHGVDE